MHVIHSLYITMRGRRFEGCGRIAREFFENSSMSEIVEHLTGMGKSMGSSLLMGTVVFSGSILIIAAGTAVGRSRLFLVRLYYNAE